MEVASRTTFSPMFETFVDRAATTPKPINIARPQMHRRSSSEKHNALMRQLMAPWGSPSKTPPECRAVSFSSWRRFSGASNNSKSSDEMKASVLLAASGTTPNFNPPLLETCDLRVPEEGVVCGNPQAERSIELCHPYIQRKSHNSSASSWSTTTSATTECSSYQSHQGISKPTTFKKQNLKSPRTSSLLTASFKESAPKREDRESPKAALERIGKQFGIEGLSLADLPEDAFESDSEDED